MTEKITIARPYAKAIFAVAQKGQKVVKIQQELLLLSKMLEQEKVVDFIDNYLLPPEEKAQVFERCFGDILSQETVGFIRILANVSRIRLMKQIHELFVDYRRTEDGIIAVDVISAFTFSASGKKEFDSMMHKLFNLKIESTYSTDETLMAGVIVRTKQSLIDCSLVGQLEKMGQDLCVAI
ncbi:MAG: F0F1 ATP synthase subunit delta [Francisellaceae bacterium]|nr:F0F1 ATP synthase subunit delta [Francisellaceae bacterium]